MERPTGAGRVASLRRRAGKALDWWRRRRRRAHEPHGLVLMYHRIASVSVDPWNLAVSPAHFDDQLGTLGRHVDFVPLAWLRDNLRAGRRSRPVVAVTFDDGYADNLLAAKPVLERYQVPATVFVASGFTGRSQAFWWDRLADAILLPPALPSSLVLAGGQDGFARSDAALSRADETGRRARRRLHDDLWAWLVERPEQDRVRQMERIEAWTGVPTREDASAWPMTSDQLRQLAAGGLVEIGAHSVSHPRLTQLPRDEQRAEIVQSRAECRRILGTDPSCFAFPNGDHDAASVELVREAGFAVGCTSRPDLAWASGEAHATPRISAPDCSGEALWRLLHWRWLP